MVPGKVVVNIATASASSTLSYDCIVYELPGQYRNTYMTLNNQHQEGHILSNEIIISTTVAANEMTRLENLAVIARSQLVSEVMNEKRRLQSPRSCQAITVGSRQSSFALSIPQPT
jgi:hypothetical protein